MMASEGGQIFDCRIDRGRAGSSSQPGEGAPDLTLRVQAIPGQPLQSADKDQPGPLKITSLAFLTTNSWPARKAAASLKSKTAKLKK
jgi:hypothetical protein